MVLKGSLIVKEKVRMNNYRNALKLSEGRNDLGILFSRGKNFLFSLSSQASDNFVMKRLISQECHGKERLSMNTV